MARRDRTEDLKKAEAAGVIDQADIVVIGAGVTGSGIARTLAKYNKRIIVVEKASDVSEGTSKSNNGMIHSGYDSKAGSLKALLNVKGNAMYTQWQEELHFKMNRCGSFVAGFDASDDAYLEQYYGPHRQPMLSPTRWLKLSWKTPLTTGQSLC